MERKPTQSTSAPVAGKLTRSDFILKPKYTNTMPDLNFEGKFLKCPFVPIERFYPYQPSELERECKFDILCDEEFGLDTDLVDLEQYDIDVHKQVELDPKDLILMEDEDTAVQSAKRSAQHKKIVPWMRKTEYISTEYNRLGISADRQETKLGYNLKKSDNVDNLYQSRQGQIDAINKTFEDVKKPARRHYNKKNVTALEEIPIFPDFENWKFEMTHVTYDGESANSNIPANLRRLATERAKIRAVNMPDGDVVAVNYTPSVEALQKMLEDEDTGRDFVRGEPYEFNINREYNWKFEENKKNEHENFVLTFRNGKAHLWEVDHVVKMQRVRHHKISKKSTLSVMYHNPGEEELAEFERRFKNLMLPDDQKIPKEGEKEEEEETRGEGASADSDASKEESNDEKSSVDDSDDETPTTSKKSKKPSKQVSSDEDDSDEDERPQEKKQVISSSSEESD